MLQYIVSIIVAPATGCQSEWGRQLPVGVMSFQEPNPLFPLSVNSDGTILMSQQKSYALYTRSRWHSLLYAKMIPYFTANCAIQ